MEESTPKIFVFRAGNEEYEAVKITSNAARIHIALSLEEYAAVTAIKGDFLEYASSHEIQFRVERKFQQALRHFKPVDAHHIALSGMARDYFGRGAKEEDYFVRGMESVTSALREIFAPAEPSELYTQPNLPECANNFRLFNAAKDSFVTERGNVVDSDGIDKVVTQICAAPRLGQFLLEQGYKMVVGYYESMAAGRAQR